MNIPVFSKFLDLRRQIAALLGYDTWADYVTEVKMVKNAKGVTEVRVARTLSKLDLNRLTTSTVPR